MALLISPPKLVPCCGAAGAAALLVFAAMLASCPTTAAQATLRGSLGGFAGIPWGSTPAVIRQSLSKRGFAYTGVDGDGDLDFQGSLEGTRVEVFEILTPRHALVKTLIGCVSCQAKAITFYRKVRDSLVREYGPPSKTLEFYALPYSVSSSDSEKQRAISAGLGALGTFWIYSDKSALNTRVNVDLGVEIDYESPQWSAEAARRKQHSSTS